MKACVSTPLSAAPACGRSLRFDLSLRFGLWFQFSGAIGGPVTHCGFVGVPSISTGINKHAKALALLNTHNRTYRSPNPTPPQRLGRPSWINRNKADSAMNPVRAERKRGADWATRAYVRLIEPRLSKLIPWWACLLGPLGGHWRGN